MRIFPDTNILLDVFLNRPEKPASLVTTASDVWALGAMLY